MGGQQLKAAAVDVNVLMLGQCNDARHRSFRSSPSFADQSQLPIHRRSIAAADLCAGSCRGDERGNPISLGFLQLIFPACGRRESFEFKFVGRSDLSPTQLSRDCGPTVCLFGPNCSWPPSPKLYNTLSLPLHSNS